MFILLQRVRWAFATVPSPAGWGVSALVAGLFASVAYPLARNHLIDPSRFLLDAKIVIFTFFAPATSEETLFRVLLTPHRKESLHAWSLALWGLLSLALYVGWHPLNAWLLTPAVRPIFYDPLFLFICTLLGASCHALYFLTGSVWPAILLHWATVVVWMSLGGKANLGL